MLQIYNNSAIKEVFLSATSEQVTGFQEYLNNNGVELIFKADVCRLCVFGIKTIKVPKKCLKSFENLCKWVYSRVNKELEDIVAL